MAKSDQSLPIAENLSLVQIHRSEIMRPVRNAFNLMPIGQLYSHKRAEVEWVVADLFMRGGLSIISADPKAGKSTIARQLTRDVLRGGTFLERKCIKGRVFYFGFEEHPSVLRRAFRRLGILESDNLFVHVGECLAENSFEQFGELIREQKPELVVIDTLLDLINVENENSYSEMKNILRRLRNVARDSGSHIVCVHHSSKSGEHWRRGNRGILGSQAIAGAMDAILMVELDGNTRVVTTSGREISQWFARELIYQDTDNTFTLCPTSD